MSIKTKILVPAIVLTLLVAAAVLVSNIVLFSDHVKMSTTERVNTALRIAMYHLEDMKLRAASASLSVAESHEIFEGLISNNRESLLAQAMTIQEMTGAEFCTIINEEGTVIARTHNTDRYGDSLASMASIKTALAGERLTAVERGSEVRLSVRSSMPVADDAGAIVGVVSVGYRLDTDTFVDTIKAISGCESTVILDGVRISTTVRDANGARVTGTRTPERIVGMLLAGLPYSGEADIQGRPSITSYAPLMGPNGQVTGALYAGQYLDQITKNIRAFVQRGLVITFIILAAFIVVVLFIVSRIVAPVYAMTKAAVALAVGDTDIDIKVNTTDEMRTLAEAFNRMIENTRLQVATVEHIAAGDLTTPVQTRSEKDVMNRALQELNTTIRAQAAAIEEEHGRVQLMLDATPLACRLWSRNFELLEGNEAAVKLFGLKNKREYLDRYFELSPEYQLDEQTTLDKVKEIVTEAFEKGECTHEWLYHMPDGTPLPCEVTLVRVPYGDDYVVAAYSRDLREQKKMMAEIEHRDHLLDIGQHVSHILFDTAEDKSVEAALVESMTLLGECVGADQAYITQNETIDGVPCFTCKSAWATGTKRAISPGMSFPWGLDLDWDGRFRQGECMNGPVKNLPPAIQEFFAPFEAQSVLVIPVFVLEKFWGLVGFSDCRKDRFFVEDEVNVLRSMGLMMAAAVHRNEQAARIREAHTRTRLLTNATPLAFNLWDRNFNNIETNDTAVQLFDLTTQDEYLRRFYELSPEHQPDGRLSKDKMRELINEAFNAGSLQFEWLHQKPDSTPVPAEVTLVRLAYGNDYVLAGYIHDMREEKKMLAEIERRDYLRQVVNETADILLRSEPDNFSGTLFQCMGMMARAINAGRMYLHKNYFDGEKKYNSRLYEWPQSTDRLEHTAAAEKFFCGDQSNFVKEVMCRGESVHSLARDLPPICRECLGVTDARALMIIPVFLKDEFWGFVGFDNCQSENLFTPYEESIMHSGSILIINALLRNESMLRIRDTSAKLQTALADAKQANNAKSSFLAQMSHEMRTPLNAVVGFSELSLDEGSMDRETKSNLEKIYGAGTTILSIVNDILDISKIESGKFELYPVQYDTPSLINDTVILNIVRIGEKPITFKLYVDENLPGKLYGDDLRVKQIFNNLLSNAFKYTQEGTVEWRVSFERDGEDIWLVSSVKDTGMGIKPGDVKKLFSDYNQVDTKTNRKIEGTGLGLAITKRLAEMMGGTITVESEYGTGSAFYVRLRQAVASDAPIGEEIAGNLMHMRYTLSRRTGKTKYGRVNLSYARVLVVDDVVTNLDVAKGMMKPYKMQIDCATSGQEAVDLIRNETPRYSAIFMDHMMPEMDGIEAVRIIREELGTDYARNIPIIALTANAIVGNNELFLNNGFQDFVSKPIDMMKLDAVLRTWVRDRELEKQFANDKEDRSLFENSAAGTDGGEKKPRLNGITMEGIDQARAMESFDGDEEIFVEVMRSFAANTRPFLANLKEYLDAENLEDYAIVVHGIKGASYGVFAQETGDAARVLELAAKAKNLDAVRAGHPVFEKTAEALLDEINRVLDEIDKR